MTKLVRITPLLLAGALALAGCGGERGGAKAGAGADLDASIPEQERYGGTAVVSNLADIPDINPLTSTDYTANQIQQYVLFMPLLTYDEKFEPVPRLARSWEVNPDTTQLTFHLRDDVFWHDGVKTSAYDLKFSYDRAREPATGFPNTAFWTYYGDMTVVDSFTVRVAMRPHAEYLDPWRSFTPAPEHILRDVPAAELRTHPFSTTQVVGNGPFKFVSREAGQNWVFAANEDFPKELGGRPYLDRIVYRIIPEPTTALTELLTGRTDYYQQPPAEQAARIESAPNARLLHTPDRYFVIIGWNERRKPFDDVRVRRAFTMAIDRQAIIDGVLYGYGQIANATVPPFFWQYDPDAGADLKYDPEAAKALLAEAGWIDRNGDGIVENEQGKPLRFTIKTNKGNQVRADIAEVVQADLRKIGVDAAPQIVEWGALLDQLQTPSRRDFDAVIIGWVTEFRIDDSDLFSCKKLNDPFQWVGYCDPATERLLDTLPKIVSREAAKPLWAEYQRKVAHDQPYTFLYFVERLAGVSDRLRNVNPDARGDWLGAERWWILPNQRGGANGR
ncbi:MAG TPA: ABC transporter substrate-binding protein [Longimicrobiaceae bacterium]|nr:ABC transporter substrate-binding protein [Longimicrobiaceae bacterium]